jgi:hypothetical protein
METIRFLRHLEEIQRILVELESLKGDIQTIGDQSKIYYKEIVEESYFFIRISNNSLKLFAIDICKLLDSKEDFSLSKTLNYAISNRKRIIWKNELTNEKIVEIREEIHLIEIKYLENFKYLRDKYFAHLDKDRGKVKIPLLLEDFWDLLKVIEKIYNFFTFHLTHETTVFSIPIEKNSELINLNKFKRIRLMILNELEQNPDIGKLQKVREIIFDKNY